MELVLNGKTVEQAFTGLPEDAIRQRDRYREWSNQRIEHFHVENSVCVWRPGLLSNPDYIRIKCQVQVGHDPIA